MDDDKFVHLAVEQAAQSMHAGGFPAGAACGKDGELLSTGLSVGNALHDPTSHAEIAAIREACQKLKSTNLAGVTLYSSMQPCAMCFSAAVWANVSRIVYGCEKRPEMVEANFYEGAADIENLNQGNKQQITIVKLLTYQKEVDALLKTWKRE